MAELKCPDCGGFRGLPRVLHDREEPYECQNQFHKEPEPIIPDDDSVTIAPVEAIPKKSTHPICPYCGTEGLKGTQTVMGNRFVIMVVRCINDDCRKIIGIFPIGTIDIPMPTN
jgi:hypothetical protein